MRRDDAPEERARVFSRIAPVVIAFRWHNPINTWHVEELLRFVRGYCPEIAPDSPGRILRQLRLMGRLNYVVINRRQSLYQFRPVVKQ